MKDEFLVLYFLSSGFIFEFGQAQAVYCPIQLSIVIFLFTLTVYSFKKEYYVHFLGLFLVHVGLFEFAFPKLTISSHTLKQFFWSSH